MNYPIIGADEKIEYTSYTTPLGDTKYLARERIFEFGRKGPFYRYMSCPTEPKRETYVAPGSTIVFNTGVPGRRDVSIGDGAYAGGVCIGRYMTKVDDKGFAQVLLDVPYKIEE